MAKNISKVYLLNVPLEDDMRNTLYFASASAQHTYFENNISKTYNNVSYQSETRTFRCPDQIDTVRQYNYIMWQNTAYSNKWFYAFIKKMTYVSDGYTDVVFTKDDGTTMTVGDLYTALTNGKSFEIDLPFGEINSACSRDSAAIVATVENVKLDGSSKQTLDQTSQGHLSEMYTSSVPVAVHLSTPWGGVLLDERFGVEHLTIDDGGTVTSSYRFVVNTYETFQPPR